MVDSSTLFGRLARAASTPAWVFLLVGFPFGLMLIGLTPPFQVPDEMVHFYRAYQISEGGFIGEQLGLSSGGSLPSSLRRTVDSLVLEGGDVRFHPDRRINRDQLRASLGVALAPAVREVVEFAGGATYSPLVYAPQVVGIALGRQLELAPILVMYLGRLFGLLGALGVTFLALRIGPVQKWAWVVVALSPMVAFLRSSLSADSMTMAVAFLAMALLSRELFEPGPIRLGRLAALTATFTALVLCKLPYGLLALGVLLIPGGRFGSRWRQTIATLAVVGAPLCAAMVWARATAHLVYSINPGASPIAQVKYVLSAPFKVALIWLADPIEHGAFYLRSSMGLLGWLDTPLPDWTQALLWCAVGVIAFAGAAPLNLVQRFLALGLASCGALLIIAALYVAWTSVGATHVEGVQGRYFLPLLPLVLLSMGRRGPALSRTELGLTMIFIGVATVATTVTMTSRYW